MSDEKTNLGQEPAFPCEHFPQDSTIEGISKRFYAACSAMQGLLSRDLPKEQNYYYTEILIQKAYRYADELLKQE